MSTVEIAGPAEAVAAFTGGLVEAAPPLAQVASIETLAEGPVDQPLVGREGFVIHASRQSQRRNALVPADIGSCAACLLDVSDPASRRYRSTRAPVKAEGGSHSRPGVSR